ncbi:dolichyl-diphosphooligosaccharide--protein glycosyltransferase subunit dad1 [Phtheirospermum japonicum]|uniref:Dolichyl-diphosphooligosaccharide--protein glycosyltransferase subunit DAD1 n=1 Tax=Phtheirospermum japonicum TaxID=374723 RepID=A0A830AY80_9LAMI|nr:dolichyl-diphosphooligosaccharide--protein glycosyltransferase subunit dad1 [Phtheirospermum japonicum]
MLLVIASIIFFLRTQVNKENKEFKDLPPERAFTDFILCNLVFHLVIMNFLG